MDRRTVLRAGAAAPVAGLGIGAVTALDIAPPPGPFPDGSYLLMPLGDSITYGSTNDSANGGNGYPAYLRSWLRGPNECNVEMVGSQLVGSQGVRREGHPGWTIGQLTALVAGGLLSQTCPQFVVLLAGANDFGDAHLRTADETLADTSALVDLLLAAAPFVRVVVCEQILMAGSISHDLTKSTWQQQGFNAGLPDLAATKVGRVVVARSSVISEQMLDASGVHPTDVGYRWLAWSVYQALAPWLGREVLGRRWMTNIPVPPGSPRPLAIL